MSLLNLEAVHAAGNKGGIQFPDTSHWPGKLKSTLKPTRLDQIRFEQCMIFEKFKKNCAE